MEIETLLQHNISFEIIDGIHYFDVGQIRDKFPEYKFDIKNFKNGKVKVQDIHPMNDFDKMIMQAKKK